MANTHENLAILLVAQKHSIFHSIMHESTKILVALDIEIDFCDVQTN